jgi:hypothetical protein
MPILTNCYVTCTIFRTDSSCRDTAAGGLKMTWQNIGLLFLAVVATCFLVAFIEVIWKSRRAYYGRRARPRGSNQTKY